ncbi:uncharacterized protein [Epargyreus clarus]|uniref:uncharacterized protein n=1 Tax=Epargyreus clarus TaxID=520877 RepID=UPI003C2EF02C
MSIQQFAGFADADIQYNIHRFTPPVPHIKYSKLSPAKWSTSVLKSEVSSASTLENAEPGFDFTEEEMEKLKLWPAGVIPYYIDEFSFDKVFRDRIRTFLAETNRIAGLNFFELYRPPEDEKSRWVIFINRQGLLGCADHPFKNFTTVGVQKVVLGYDCLATGGELAEAVLALVGVPPQHNAPDRDEYINIVEKNIMPGKAYLFNILKNDEWLFHEVDYDFLSAGHYSLHKYTVNGMATIEPVREIKVTIGEGTGFSYNDIWKIRMLYNFISKKRLRSANVPECSKLFNLSSNFSNFEPESEDEVQPRKKPPKYLGLPDNTQGLLESPTGNSHSEEPVGSTPPSNIKSNKKASSEEDDSEGVEYNVNQNMPEINNSKEEFPKSNKMKQKVPVDPEKILELSDYKTEDENELKPADRKFTRPGGKQRIV